MKNFYIALIHHPVTRNGNTITSSIANLDIHDISRVSLTYGLGGYFIVHPDEKMRHIANSLVKHWVEGAGKEYNADRFQAVKSLKIVSSLEEVTNEIIATEKKKPLIAGTTARKKENSVSVKELKKHKNNPILLLFGTAGGIEDNFLNSLDFILEPIGVEGGYNHLSVRSAVSIFIDRLYSAE
ncbi:MAG: RNA methyltransferase [bacterium]